MKQYLPRAALAVLLCAVCAAAQSKTFKCLSSSRLDCPDTTDVVTSPVSTDTETTTFRGKTGSGGGGSTTPQGSGQGGSFGTPPNPRITTAVPEPESYAMMAVGMGIIAWALRRRREA